MAGAAVRDCSNAAVLRDHPVQLLLVAVVAQFAKVAARDESAREKTSAAGEEADLRRGARDRATAAEAAALRQRDRLCIQWLAVQNCCRTHSWVSSSSSERSSCTCLSEACGG